MMNKALFFALLGLSGLVWAAEAPSNMIFQEEEGFLMCGGGTQVALFAKDCQRLSLKRISVAGAIKYEGTCVEPNGKTHFLACDALSFEYQQKKSDKDDTYWQKSKRNQGPSTP